MESTRQLKVARLLQKEMGEMFQRELGHHFGNAFISVTKIRISPDLSHAKAYLSIFGNNDKTGIMDKIKEIASEIRGKMGNRIGKQLRIVPTFEFFLDDSADYAAKIDELLKK
ncbi:MAG TPA: 30S ribosome-binding factor RbfA [Bacteroidia bacterium]|nr:30S ribosome-binding factor RbfA [Bacteroidia bacterium]